MLNLNVKQIFLARLIALRAQMDAITIPLDTEVALGKSFERVDVILTGWTAELGHLIENLTMEIRHEQELIAADEEFKRFYIAEIQGRPLPPKVPPAPEDDDDDTGGLISGM